MDWVQIIQTLGFPIFAVIACFWFIAKNVDRDRDESKEREDKLIDANSKNADALVKVADTIERTNEINQNLMDKLDNKIDKVEQDVQKVLGIIDKD